MHPASWRLRTGLSIVTLVFALGHASCGEADLSDADLLDTNANSIDWEIVETLSDNDIIPGRYVVILKEAVITPARQFEPLGVARHEKEEFSRLAHSELRTEVAYTASRLGVSARRLDAVYTAALSGFSAALGDGEVARLREDPRVASVHPDRVVRLDAKVEAIGVNAAQTETCAISEAGGPGDGSAKDTWIWVVDSGIDLDHSDLNVVTNSTYARSFVGGSADDCNGHGTHVAGIAAAKNNSFGVVGVSAGAAVVPVRVFGCSGGSSTSTILSGIDHVARYDISGDVMNLSLGGYYGSNCSSNSPYRSSISSVANGGSRVSISAGNSSANAAYYQPACVGGTRIYTVASRTCSGSFSSFSNYGIPPIDWIAVGSSVYSTYKNGGYATLSGTSMSAPVVSGIAHYRTNAPQQCGSVSYGGQSYKNACR